MRRSRVASRSLALVLAAFLLTSSAFAAEVTASLLGTIRDASGAVVTGATISLTNTQTNVTKKTQSGNDGEYSFTLVPVGQYKLTVERSGFRKYVQDGIILQVNQAAKQDISLEVGAQTEVIEVTGDVAQVDTVTATLGSVETQRRIVDLPLVERDTFQLGLLQAGVFAPDPDDGSGNPFSVSGQRSESLTFLIDGVDNNDFLGNNAVVDPNPDAVEEFKILTNNYGAEYGRTSGGIVNQVIKSGTNAFHGGVFEFFRNDDLNARNYFQPTRTRFNRNLFGGTLGGPIKKDKTFFFMSYQGSRRIEGQVAPVLDVLSPAQRGCVTVTAGCVGTVGDFSSDLPTQLVNPIDGTDFPNNQVPINPIIATYISKYLPLPNVPGKDQFAANPIGRIQEDQGIIRIDHHISGRDSIYGNWIINDVRDAYPFRIINGASSGGNVPIGSGFGDATRSQQGAITWTHIFSPHVINEFIFGSNRVATLMAIPADTTSPADLGFTNVNPDDLKGVAPPILFSNTFQLGPSPQGPTKEHDVTFHWQDSVSWNKGHHDLKFGADIRRIRNNFNFDFFNNGSFDFANIINFTGDGFADFVGGFPDNYFQFSNAAYGIRTYSLNFYGQDSWKILPRLTLNLGARYEYNSPQKDPHNNIIGFFPGQQSTVFPDAPAGLLYPGDPGIPNSGMVFPDKNNLAPRFGFSWDVLGNAKLVMRGGFGIFYDIEDGALNLQFGGQPPFGDVSNLNFTSFTPGADPIADPFNSFAPGTVNPFPFIAGGRLGQFFVPKVSFAFVVDPHFRTPYSENYNYGLQYQLTKDTLIEAYYVGSLGRKLITSADVNFPQPGILRQQLDNSGGPGVGFTNADCARPLAGCSDPTDPNSSLVEAGQLLTDHSNGMSASHEFQLTIDKRFSGGFNLRGAYTLAKTIDVQSGFRARSSLQTDPLDQSLDRGLADFDATHRLVISGSWEIPWDKPFRNSHFMRKLTEGWQINGIASFQSGAPFTIFSNDNQSQQGSGLDRADRVGKAQTFNARTNRSFTVDDSGISGSCLGNPGDTVTGHFYFNPLAYDCLNVSEGGGIPLFSFGNSGRNSLRGPGINNVDLSVFKTFKFNERSALEFRTEFFNAFNHTQFLLSGNASTVFGFTGSFGQLTQARDPRIIQFALKLSF